MIALDASVLVDYLDGDSSATTVLENYGDRPFGVPTIALFEVYRGATRTGGRDALERARDALDWVEPLGLTEAVAREATLIEAELLAAGEPVNLGDTLVAGTCRHYGAPVVTRDRDFERIDGLDVLEY